MERILIVKVGSLGDIIHTLPCLAALKEALPESRISWLVERIHSVILDGHPLLESVIPLDTKAWRKNPLSGETLKSIREKIKEIRKQKTSLAFDFQGLLKSGFFTAVSGSPLRIGFPLGKSRERLNRIFLNKTYPNPNSPSHVIKENLHLVGAYLGNSPQTQYSFPLPDRFLAEAEKFFPEQVLMQLPEKEVAVLNPGGGWPTKRWPVEKYSELASLLLKETPLSVFISYGPGEEGLAESIRETIRDERLISFPTDLYELSALLRRAKIFIGGDTGPFHLAVALGTPVVGIFGPTDPAINGSIRPADLHVTKNLDCAPCHKRKCKTEECIREINTPEVFAAFQERLKRMDNG